jgi:CubicO group peptidase (beta-lactamase class C family)
MLNILLRKNDIINNPGKDFYYGSTGFVIAGRVLEVISKKKTFDQLMRERIFKPLLMKRGSFRVDTGSENPATGGSCSAADYLNFLAMILNKGTFNGKKVLSEKSIAEMEKIRTQPVMIKSTPAIMSTYNYTMGAWAMEEDGKRKCHCFNQPFIYRHYTFRRSLQGLCMYIFFTMPLKRKR